MHNILLNREGSYQGRGGGGGGVGGGGARYHILINSEIVRNGYTSRGGETTGLK